MGTRLGVISARLRTRRDAAAERIGTVLSDLLHGTVGALSEARPGKPSEYKLKVFKESVCRDR